MEKEKKTMTCTEKAIIAGMLDDKNRIPKATEKLTENDFDATCNKMLFATISELFYSNSAIDALTVSNRLKEKYGAKYETYDFINKMLSTGRNYDGFDEWIRLVKQASLRREQRKLGEYILKNTEESSVTPVDEINEKIMRNANELIQSDSAKRGPQNVSAVLKEAKERLANLSGPDREKYLGIKTGFADLDEYILGMAPGDLVLVGARPAMGKTAFALNIARNVAMKLRKKTLVFSLEMSSEQLMQRLLAMETHIDSKKFRMGKLDEKDMKEIEEASNFMTQIPLFIDDNANITVAEIKAKTIQTGAEFVIIDYLSLIRSASKTENRVQEISQITRDLKIFAKTLQMPVMVLAQLNRGTEQQTNHRPQLADLRESGSIEQDADVVLMLYRDSYYNGNEGGSENNMIDGVYVDIEEILIRKNRHGETGVVRLAWIPSWTMFDSLANEEETPQGAGNRYSQASMLDNPPAPDEDDFDYDYRDEYEEKQNTVKKTKEPVNMGDGADVMSERNNVEDDKCAGFFAVLEESYSQED